VRGSQVRILVEMAKGANKLKEISAAVNRSPREVSQQLKELMEHELIVKTGVFYRFHNKIFKFWLREVYEKKELSLLGSRAKAENFLVQVKRLLGDYAELVKMDVGSRLVELLKLFRNEVVEFGEKKRQLPHFTEFLSLDTDKIVDGPSRDIIASGHGRCWVCKVVKDRASEADILDLLSRDAQGKASPTRVLVALGGLDDNAKLLAKEKKVIALGLSRINLLMDLYGKEPILSRRTPGGE
jgi:DNA-binding transcriptional ArsR family regulator